jgi:hypothetical protein
MLSEAGQMKRVPEINRTRFVRFTETPGAKEKKVDDTDASPVKKMLAGESFKIFVSFRWIFG